MTMRYFLFLLGLLCFATAMTPRAEAQNYPWCAALNMGDVSYNCGFDTREQCMASVSGIGGWCERNTQYQPPSIPDQPSSTPASPARAPSKQSSH
jgi:hypothetical protein